MPSLTVGLLTHHASAGFNFFADFFFAPFSSGGGGIIASFLDEGEIDEFVISVIPILIGEGIPLIAPRHRTIPLKLLSTKKFPDGVVTLHYALSGGKRSVPSA